MNYGELKTAIAEWTHRTYEDSVMDLLVEMAQMRIGRDAALMELETTATITGGTGALPTDFMHARSVWIDASGGPRVLEYLTPNQFQQAQNLSGGQSQYYTLQQNQLMSGPGTNDVHLTYLTKPADLVSDSSTNLLLTNWPNLILWACCAEAYRFLQDIEQLGYAEQQYQDELLRNLVQAETARYSGNAKIMR